MDMNEKFDDLLRLLEKIQNELPNGSYGFSIKKVYPMIDIDSKDLDNMLDHLKKNDYLHVLDDQNWTNCRLTMVGLKFIQNGGFVGEQKDKVIQRYANDAAMDVKIMTKKIIRLTMVFIWVTAIFGLANIIATILCNSTK